MHAKPFKILVMFLVANKLREKNKPFSKPASKKNAKRKKKLLLFKKDPDFIN
jgi:hypothetical protein